jgi:two-component system LytT family sensor kinase
MKKNSLFLLRTTYRIKPIVTQMSVVVGEYYFKVTDTGRNRRYATRFDPVTRLPLDLKLPADSYSAILLEFKSHETIPYSVYLAQDIDGKKDTVPLDRFWPDNHFLCENWQYNKPGKYVLIIQRAQELNYWNEAQILRLPFEVVPPPLLEKKVSLRNIILYSIATLLGVAFLFFAYWRNSKRKIARETRARQTAYRQLRAVRSQLNPHFIFNSLSSIQSLMNKNDVGNANHYLVKFASLTRKVLDHSEQELISLEEEIKSLDDYLQMEQLRFRFRYTIRVDEAINQANTEIPVLLLQPFVENAIKHAVAGLQEKGIIEIGIEQKGNALILWVRDNGTGFAGDIAGSGNGTRANTPAGEQGKSSFGIKLSRERITLLNQIYKEKTALLDIDPADTGTKVTIQLNNWL